MHGKSALCLNVRFAGSVKLPVDRVVSVGRFLSDENGEFGKCQIFALGPLLFRGFANPPRTSTVPTRGDTIVAH